MTEHGFATKHIYNCLEKFDEETKEEQEKYKTFDEFNDAILKAKGKTPLAKICKGIFVGNILLKNARKQNHPYLLAKSELFIVIIPFGPIQSVIHTLAIPKIPMYNAVSLGMNSVLLLQKMQAALVKVVTDVLTPDSLPQKLYLQALSAGIDRKPTDISNIRITQSRKNFDTNNFSGAQAIEIIQGMLKDYFDEKMKSGIPLEEAVCTDLHIHDTNSVGQLHMHGWIAQSGLITDNGMKLQYKNTPLDRIVPVLTKFRGGELRKKGQISVVVRNKDLI